MWWRSVFSISKKKKNKKKTLKNKRKNRKNKRKRRKNERKRKRKKLESYKINIFYNFLSNKYMNNFKNILENIKINYIKIYDKESKNYF
jgi:hypothetical protein